MKTTPPIKIGTRKSKLAMWQAEHVASQLKAEGHEVVLLPIETKGDKILNVALSKIGSKGLFTEELDHLLREGEIHLAVHSAKDVQSRMEEGMELLAFGEREFPGDVLLAFQPMNLEQADEKAMVIGTSSTRRVATLKRFFRNIVIKDVRGNLQTRIGKLENGDYDALILAYAGVKRMGYEHLIQEKLPLDLFTPAVGQGSIAVQVHASLAPELKESIRNACNHPPSEDCLLVEREFLATLEGGCSVPVFGLAQDQGDSLHVRAGIIGLDGQEMLVEEAQFLKSQSVGKGKEIAKSILNRGGDYLLKTIKKELYG